LRGLAYFTLEIEGAKKDLHSGVFGGSVGEAMTDLVHLMSKLVDSKGNILVPGISSGVKPLTEEELKLYKDIKFDLNQFQQTDTASKYLLQDSKEKLLMARWRYPSLSLHGIEGAFSGVGAKTVIPGKVTGKFSIRLVPDQDPSDVQNKVSKFLTEEFSKLGSKNSIKIESLHAAKAWMTDPNHPNYKAAKEAIKQVWKVDPYYTREGGSIPVTLTFQEATGKNVLLLPIGKSDDGAHSQNEKLDRLNYINGIKVLASYLEQIAKLPK